MTAKYTGYLRRDASGAITGQLVDAWGWVVTIAATPSPEGGYTLDGTLGDIPSALRLPMLDDETPS